MRREPDRADLTWPPLPLGEWSETCATLHRWTQIAGKVRLACSPWINHSWHATLYVTPRGLSTGALEHGVRSFELEFDFLAHRLVLCESRGARRELELRPRSVADLYAELIERLDELHLGVELVARPNEVEDPTPLDRDTRHAAYDPHAARRFWQILVGADRVLRRFRSRFRGKSSPVHFFWGSFDLAVTRFSGRPAPEHPGGVPNLPDAVTREAYSHEVSSAGFWPGTPGGPVDYPAFYSYAYPTPAGFAAAAVRPLAAFWEPTLGEFVLPYDAVRQAPAPEEALLEFLQTTYEAAAEAARWDRAALERPEGPPAGLRRVSASRPPGPTAGRP
jgi:hypothetical protein